MRLLCCCSFCSYYSYSSHCWRISVLGSWVWLNTGHLTHSRCDWSYFSSHRSSQSREGRHNTPGMSTNKLHTEAQWISSMSEGAGFVISSEWGVPWFAQEDAIGFFLIIPWSGRELKTTSKDCDGIGPGPFGKEGCLVKGSYLWEQNGRGTYS